MVEKSKIINGRKVYWNNKKYEDENAGKAAAMLYKKEGFDAEVVKDELTDSYLVYTRRLPAAKK